MTLLVAKADGVAPATEEFTLDHPSVTDKVGPFLVALESWTHTADGSANGYQVSLEYVDPVGVTRVVQTSGLDLADPEGINVTQVTLIERLSDVSNFKFKTLVLGSGGSALVSYRLAITPADVCDIQTLALIPV